MINAFLAKTCVFIKICAVFFLHTLFFQISFSFPVDICIVKNCKMSQLFIAALEKCFEFVQCFCTQHYALRTSLSFQNIDKKRVRINAGLGGPDNMTIETILEDEVKKSVTFPAQSRYFLRNIYDVAAAILLASTTNLIHGTPR